MVAVLLVTLIFLCIYIFAEYRHSEIKWANFLQRRSNPPNPVAAYGAAKQYFCKYCHHPSDSIIEGDRRLPNQVCLDCKNAISVVTIGPDYKNHRGGIGAVLEVYSNHITDFHFIASYQTSFKQFWVFIVALITYTFKLITNRRIKIVHLHNASKASFIRKSILLLIGKLFGKKVILHVHGAKFDSYYENSNPVLKKYMKFIIEKADVVICLSLQWKIFFEKHFKIRKLEILNNIVEEANQSTPDAKPAGAIDFLFLGAIGERKGIFDLVKMLNDNDALFRGKYTLTIAGNGEIDRLKTAIKDNPAIKYVGWVRGQEKEELLKNCDVYILPSYHEGLPISVLEAMSHAKPIISTNVGGIPEILITEHNGWLLKPGDLEGLKSAVSKAVDTMSLNYYGANSLTMAKNFHPVNVMENLNRIYSEELT